MNAKMRQRIEKMISGEAPAAPIAELIGFQLVKADDGKAVVEFEAKQKHANPMGTLHGGVLCDIADAAMGIAYGSTLDEGESFTTLELKINFFKPIWNAKLTAAANVIKRGKNVGFVECEILDQKQTLVAKSSSTCLTLRGKAAENR